MTIIQTIILGIVQGLTEFLPISSTAHLHIIPWALGWIGAGGFQTEAQIAFESAFNGFDIALHFGTLLAVGIFFFKDWIKLLVGGFNQVIKKEKSAEGKMFFYIVIATIPGGTIGFILQKYVEEYLKQPLIIAFALILMGIILYIVDRNSKNETEYEDMSFKQTFLIGLSQCLAFIPGVSRSGITTTTGRLLGVKRESAARYSFMLSAPIILGATLFEFSNFLNPEYREIFISSGMLLPFIIGILASFVVGIIVIKFLLEYLKKGSFKVFSIYRAIIGVAIIFIYLFVHK